MIWGDYEPEWKTEKDFQLVFSLLIRYMSSITNHLINEPESFEPLFTERKIDGKSHTIVDEWCYGYMMGVELIADKWNLDSVDMKILIILIKILVTKAGWAELHDLSEQERKNIRRTIHGYWLAGASRLPMNPPGYLFVIANPAWAEMIPPPVVVARSTRTAASWYA